MSAVVSIASGAAAEAAQFGVPAFFLSEESRGPFAGLIERGDARVIDVQNLTTEIARLPATPPRPERVRQPALSATLLNLDAIAQAYSLVCRGV